MKSLHSTEDVIELLLKLQESEIDCFLQSNRNDAITIAVAVPGSRWEIDFLVDGTIEIEVFKSNGTIFDQEKLLELFDKYSDE